MPRHACSHPGWNKSPEWRAIAREAILKHHETRHLLPRCGATRKSTGEPCQCLPMRGRTRCRLHGGATPKGPGPTGWHTPAFPGGIPTGKPRNDAYKHRRRWKAIGRIEDMTPEQRARYDAWQASHAAGSPGKRQRRRQDRDAAQWLQALLQEPHDPPPAPPKVRKSKAPNTERAIRDRIGVFA